MSLPSLFLKQDAKNDSSLMKLPQDMDLWAENIVTRVKEKIPSARDMIIKINFTKRNEELGTVTGSVVVHNQKLNKAVFVPIIVKNFSMYPLDIMLVPIKGSTETQYEAAPFTEDYFQEAMFNAQPFDHLERPIDRIQEMYMNPVNTVVYPPYFRNVYASAGSQMIDAISSTMRAEDKAELINTLKNNKNILIGYEKNANLDVLKKIASSEIKATEEGTSKLLKVTLLKNNGKNIQTISTSDEVFDPIVEEKSELDVTSDMKHNVKNPEEIMNDVRRNGEKLVFNDLKPEEKAMLGPNQTPGNYTKTYGDASDVKTFGEYKVLDKNGVHHTGIVFPEVFDFDMKKMPVKLFHSLNKAAYQGKIVGIPTGKSGLQNLKFRQPSIGATGVFVAHDDKKAFTTIPVTIRSIADISGEEHIVAMDLNGKKIKIKYGGYVPSNKGVNSDELFGSDSEDLLNRVVKIKDFYILPRRFKFLALDQFTDLMESPVALQTKLASFIMDATPVRIIHNGSNQFAAKGPDMAKMASMLNWDATNLSTSQVVFLLTAKRCPLTKTAEAIKTACSHMGEVYIHHLPAVQYRDSLKKVANSGGAFESRVRALRVNLVKEAASFEDAQVVDSVLSLNFINPENVDKMIGFIPLFDQSIKALCHTLLASRLGMNEIPQHDTTTALYKMVEVVKGLKRLRTPEEKTASQKKKMSARESYIKVHGKHPKE